MTNLSKSTAKPNLRDVLGSYKENILGTFNCCKIGTIDSFNSAKQTASIQLVFKAVFEGREYKYPLLVDCPVIFLGGSDKSLQIPVNKGDDCVVLFSDIDMDNWFQGSYNQTPASNRKHDLSDGIALVGIRNLQNSITSFENDKVKLVNGSSFLSLSDSGEVDLNNGTSNLTLNAKINLGNNISDLKVLLDTLIDTVKAIITTGTAVTQTVSAPSQAALDVVKGQIAQVFE